MTRVRIIISATAFLATFAWLLLPELRSSPAVLWPSVLAVGLAFVTRDIYVSLFLGSLAGSILVREGQVWQAFGDLFSRYLVPALSDPWNIKVLMFTLLMGGLVEVLHRNGSMKALAIWILGRAHSRRRAALGTYGLGFLIFFDGLANSMLVGKTMRPLTDRAGVSREKLAFVVDSTSSPIAGLALISTWVAYEMSVIQQGIDHLGISATGASALASSYQYLFLSLPYRFYNYFMLLIVFLVIWLNRDLGPMVNAEKQAARDQAKAEKTSAGSDTVGDQDSPGTIRKKILLGLAPLVVLILGVFGGLYVEGGGLDAPLTRDHLIQVLGRADAASVFVLSTAVASLLAMTLSALSRANSAGTGPVPVFFEGMQRMFLPTLILVFAWMLNGVIKELGTAQVLVSLLGDQLAPGFLPALVFLLSAVVSFSTGTSWGTMAIVMPLVIPLAYQLTGLPAEPWTEPVLLASIGAVLAGAVFGDHCSPISDTTIVSAFSSDCGVMAHVRTQLPYALLGAGLATLLGYAPAGWGVSPWLLLPLGGIACWAVLRFYGRLGPTNPV